MIPDLFYYVHILKLIWRYIKMKIKVILYNHIDNLFFEKEDGNDEVTKIASYRTRLTQSCEEFLPFARAEKTAFTVLDFWFPQRHLIVNAFTAERWSVGIRKRSSFEKDVFYEQHNSANNDNELLCYDIKQHDGLVEISAVTQDQWLENVQIAQNKKMLCVPKSISLPTVLLLANEITRRSRTLMKLSWKNRDPIGFVEHLLGKNVAHSLIKNNNYLELYQQIVLFTEDAVLQEDLQEVFDIAMETKIKWNEINMNPMFSLFN